MPGTELRAPGVHSRIGPQRGRLRNAASVFWQISADVDARPDKWLVAIGVALDGLEAAWEEHVSFTEGPDGLFDELLDETLEVASEVDRLRRDHEVVEAHIARVREMLAARGPAPTTPGSSWRSPGSASRSTSTAAGAPTSSTGSTASTSPPATDGRGPDNPGPGPTIDQTVTVRVFRCFSFVDMCGFTRMNDTLGDDEALAVLAEFRSIVRGLSPDHGIRVGKWLGDGCMFVGTEVRPVVETLLDLTERMQSASIVLPLRIGIAAGRVIVFEGDDFIGMSINLASRLCDAAAPGEILANDEVVQALGDEFPVDPARRAADPRHRDAHPGVADRHARDGRRRAPAELRGVT